MRTSPTWGRSEWPEVVVLRRAEVQAAFTWDAPFVPYPTPRCDCPLDDVVPRSMPETPESCQLDDDCPCPDHRGGANAATNPLMEKLRAAVHNRTRQLLAEPLLAGVRHPFLLASLPADEAREWLAFWGEIRRLRDATARSHGP